MSSSVYSGWARESYLLMVAAMSNEIDAEKILRKLYELWADQNGQTITEITITKKDKAKEAKACE